MSLADIPLDRVLTGGIDVGSSAVKAAVIDTRNDPSQTRVLATEVQRIRRRDARAVIAETWETALRRASLAAADIDYVATTGEGELVEFRRGHFYGMTAHARGALFLLPEARGAIDIGALHARAIKIDERGRVLDHRMTSQCASGSGQFLENIARYLGVALAEVGAISIEGTAPEKVSSICAVLAETDVINMVSRGISTANILKGIHVSMAGRFVKLIASSHIQGTVLLTGGLATDQGLLSAMREEARRSAPGIELCVHSDSVFAGALGAALWGGFRHRVLERRRLADAGRLAAPASVSAS